MEKSYLIVVRLDNEYYLQMSKVTNNGFYISAFEDKDEAIDKFDSFKQGMRSPIDDCQIAASIAIMNLRPHIIGAPIDNPAIVKDYIIDHKPLQITVGIFGSFVSIVAVKVSNEILELSTCDVAKEYISELCLN